ncbi:MAG: PTS lactose transporter subunit IIBC, partial [Erysipelotrichaceae bacterium]|nr:PTS lactose transporter subunit IIBC [Erysipelotrichaceae bacterium]
MIPMWLNAIIPPIVLYILLAIGFCPVPSAPMQMWYLPIYIQGFLSTGSIMGVVTVVILTVVSLLIWYPFFKVWDKAEAEKEALETK